MTATATKRFTPTIEAQLADGATYKLSGLDGFVLVRIADEITAEREAAAARCAPGDYKRIFAEAARGVMPHELSPYLASLRGMMTAVAASIVEGNLERNLTMDQARSLIGGIDDLRRLIQLIDGIKREPAAAVQEGGAG